MERKIDKLRQAMSQEDWRKAVSIASKFPRLGSIRGIILDGQMAYTNPRFMKQIRKDPEQAKLAARDALISTYAT
jgi:hypothetical protein